GVFLAIDPKNVEIVKRVIEIAREKSIPVSFDPNIRLKLWTIEEARAVYAELFPFVDILLTGRDEIELILGDASEAALVEFAQRFQIEQLVIKDGANGSKVYHNGVWHVKKAFPVVPVDTVGA
ncbi:PfkB family carbohydrate kinase, partial [Rhizobium ruizarguesonis]